MKHLTVVLLTLLFLTSYGKSQAPLLSQINFIASVLITASLCIIAQIYNFGIEFQNCKDNCVKKS
jgi:hypothetical protein